MADGKDTDASRFATGQRRRHVECRAKRDLGHHLGLEASVLRCAVSCMIEALVAVKVEIRGLYEGRRSLVWVWASGTASLCGRKKDELALQRQTEMNPKKESPYLDADADAGGSGGGGMKQSRRKLKIQVGALFCMQFHVPSH